MPAVSVRCRTASWMPGSGPGMTPRLLHRSAYELRLQPIHDGVGDVLRRLTGGAAHVMAVRIDAGALRTAVLHQQVDVGDRRLVIELAVDAEDRRRRLVDQAHGDQR